MPTCLALRAAGAGAGARQEEHEGARHTSKYGYGWSVVKLIFPSGCLLPLPFLTSPLLLPSHPPNNQPPLLSACAFSSFTPLNVIQEFKSTPLRSDLGPLSSGPVDLFLLRAHNFSHRHPGTCQPWIHPCCPLYIRRGETALVCTVAASNVHQ
nr:uncharacterized protein CTRU02_01039 [Colletotrichum truncatum]KAF6800634.1 hypothetical protein CTRU02_01039 [Colletotrichum truncatum]